MLRYNNQLLRTAFHSKADKLHMNQWLNNHLSSRNCTKEVSTSARRILLSKSTQIKGEETPILYSFYNSSCSWRVRIALNFKNIPYEIKGIDLLKSSGGEQHSDEYRKVNPMKKVPTLQIDGHSLIESVAIMHYLEETRPQPSLLPHDAYKRAKVREIVEIICSGIQPLQNVGVLQKFEKNQRLDWAQQWINQGFGALEQILSKSAGKYCIEDQITMTDCCFLPQVLNARRYKVDMSAYPIISRIESELEKVPAFADTHPNKQPDCPKEMRKLGSSR